MSGEEEFVGVSRKVWREWLEKNHKTKKMVWLVKYKVHTKKKSIKYDESVEEAICFGWIDSTVKRIDDEKYKQKFTPRRKNGSNWSKLNLSRARKLIDEGLMRDAGLKAHNIWIKNHPEDENSESDSEEEEEYDEDEDDDQIETTRTGRKRKPEKHDLSKKMSVNKKRSKRRKTTKPQPFQKSEIPQYLLKALKKSEVLDNFMDHFTNSSKRLFVKYTVSCKRESTRSRRIKKVVEMVKEGRSPNTL